MSFRAGRRARLAGLLALALGGTLVAGVVPAGASPGEPGPDGVDAGAAMPLYLVTLRDPGTGGPGTGGPGTGGPGTGDPGGGPARVVDGARLVGQQQAVLDAVDAPTPIYRWTTALNGFAVHLTADQAAVVAAEPSVALVERDAVRPLAALGDDRSDGGAGLGVQGPERGGAGEVIGVVDTGLAPDSPLFAQVTSATPDPRRLGCTTGEGWSASDCNGKVVAAHYFVQGFGADHLRSAAALSPLDTDGHGTQMASIAAGNAGVPVTVAGERLGRYGGMAPQAQIAVYKACWSAPDPTHDGCSTADLVAAVDQATADGVDVLNLSVAGPDRIDTVERALLGATESGVVVAGAAGNTGGLDHAAHPSPWVTTVGATTGEERRGRVVLRGGPRLTGAMLSAVGVGDHRLVLAARVPASGSTHEQARVCTPGSLDAARVGGRVVVCERGRVGRVDKSQAVALADGVGMVLVNVRPGSTDADVQAVPTVHLGRRQGRTLEHYVVRHPAARARLAPAGTLHPRARVARWSSPGDARLSAVKPDVVAPGTAVLGAVPGGADDAWDFVTGTSAATAYTSGVAATLLSRRGATPARVRSALVTTAAPVLGASVLHSGAGRVRATDAARPGLAYLVPAGAYRAWLDGRRTHLNTPSVLLAGGATLARRTVTNVSGRRLYFSSSARGFRSDVLVTPAAVQLGPGESATFTVRVLDGAAGGGDGRLDDGYVVWRGATGTVTRMPVVLAR